MPRKPSKSLNHKLSKSEYVLSLPHLPAKEVVARAKAEGFDVTARQVYGVREYHRKTAAAGSATTNANGASASPKRAPAKAGRPRGRAATPVVAQAAPAPTPAAAPSPNGRHGAIEQQMIEIVIEIGLRQTEELFGRVRSKILALAAS